MVRIGVVAIAAGAVAVSAAGVSGAWPTTVTPEMQRYIDNARGAGATGDDDALLTQGYLACHVLYTGQGWRLRRRPPARQWSARRAARCAQAPG